MAIQDTNEAPSSSSSDKAFSFRSDAQRQESTPRVTAMSSMRSGPMLAMNRSRTSEAVSRLATTLMSVLEKNPVSPAFTIKVVPIDPSSAGLSVGVVALAMSHRDSKSVVYMPLLIEASVEKMPVTTKVVAGQTSTLRHVSIDLFGENANAAVAKAVGDYCQGDLIPLQPATIPSNFDVMDAEAVHNLLVQAQVGLSFRILETVPGTQDLVVSGNQDTQLKINIAYGQSQITDAVGQPVRADTVISMVMGNAQQNQPIDSGSSEATTGFATGFVDLVPTAAASDIRSRFGRERDTRMWVPRFVITHLESLNYTTLPGQIWTLLAASAVRANMNWMYSLKPKSLSKTNAPWSDAGIIARVTGLVRDGAASTESFDLTSNYSDRKLADLLGQYVDHERCVLSMDISEADLMTWINCVWVDAALGKSEAINAIVSAADSVFNGNFSKHFDPNKSKICYTDSMVYQGWFSNDNVPTDLRSIDHIAVANLTVGDAGVDVLSDFAACHADNGADTVTKLDELYRIYEEELGIQPVINSRSYRINLGDEFLAALDMAAGDCKVTFSAPNSDNGIMGNAFRGIGNFDKVSGNGARMSTFGSTDRAGFGVNLNRGFGRR